MKKILILSHCLLIFVAVNAQNLIRATIIKGTAANSVDVWMTPNFNSDGTEYIYQVGLPIGWAASVTPAPTGLIITMDAAPIAQAYTVAVFTPPTASTTTDPSATFNYFNVNLQRTLSTAQTWTSGTPFRLLTATFTYSSAPTAPAKDYVYLLDDQTGGSDGNGQYYVNNSANQYYNDGQSSGAAYNSANNFYSATGSTNGGSSTLAFATTSSQIILPITLTSFTAAKVGTGVNLNWLVSAELNAKGYDVEHSVDGKNFTTITFLAATGASAYNTVDANPTIGVNYYRLKMIDIDGKFKYSSVVPVNFNGTAGKVSVWPNPVVNTTKVAGLTGTNTIAVIDDSGRQVASYTSTSTTQNIQMGSFAAGVYALQVTAADGTITTLKVVKQ